MSKTQARGRSRLKELWRQFRLPLLIAVCWTIFKGWEAMPIKSYPEFLGTIVTQFSSGFFLLSWAWGQYNRVDRQEDTTARLQVIQDNLEESQKANARMFEVQKQQAAIFKKLEAMTPTDPGFRS